MKKINQHIYLFCLTTFFVLTANASVTIKSKLENNPNSFIARAAAGVSFTENKGQVHDQNYKPRPDVLFGAMAGNMSFHLKTTGVSYQLYRVDAYKNVIDGKTKEIRKEIDKQTIYRIDLNWLNHNSNFTQSTDDVLPGCNNYYTESCPNGALNVKSYTGVTLRNLYNGINLHYYEKNGQLKHDYIVAAGANYEQIQLEVKGAQISINKDGTLLLTTPLGMVQEGAPIVYQNNQQLKAKWILTKQGDKQTLSFAIENYNPNQELIIDPVTRLWGTYYGGSSDERGYSCTTDASGDVYLAGETASSTTTLIATLGSHQVNYGGNQDAFLVKFNSAGVRQWGTYYGGSGFDRGYSCAIDATGNVYLAGETGSSTTTLIATPGSHQVTYGGGASLGDAFLVKFNSAGARQWGTYYGGSGDDRGYSCATDASGNVYLAGETKVNTGTVIATPGSHQANYGGSEDAFLVKFNSAGVRQWGTFYGINLIESGNSCSTDASGNVYLAGNTSSGTTTLIATPGSHQVTNGGNTDAFLVKFNSAGVRQWGTYYGGNGQDLGTFCATDASGNVFLTGSTATSILNVIATSGSHQATIGGGNDAFLVKFNSAGARQWGTYYGGSGTDYGSVCATDANGKLYLAGWTASGTTTLIATPGSHQITNGGGNDAFLVEFNNTSGVRQWGTYYGGSGGEIGYSCATDANSNVYLVGNTASATTTLIATPGSHQTTYGGGGSSSGDAFLVKFLNACDVLNPSAQASTNVCAGASINFTATITGTATPTYSWSGPNSFVSAIQNPSIAVVGITNSGAYTLTTNNSGCIETTTVQVTVNASPTISVNSGSICSGVSFTINPTGASTYTISGGSAIVSPTSNTTYSVTGTSAQGCTSSNTAISSVTVNAIPVISVNSGSICSGNSFTINPTGANTYTISGGSAVVSPTINTSYNVTGTSVQGCVSSNTAVSSVTVNARPTIAVNSGSICSGGSFTINPTGANTYTISGGSAIVSPTTNTSYNITGTSAQGCVSSNTAISSVTVNAKPTISVNSGSICAGNSFTINPSGASTYTISGGSTVVSPTTNTSYNVTGTSALGCISSNTAVSSITVNAIPVVSVNSGSICSGNSFTINPSGASTYTISSGSTIVTPTINTSYNVTGTSAQGCVSSNTAVSSVTVNAKPTISVNSGSICSGNSFTINPSGANTYTISGGSSVVNPTTNTSYNVIGTNAQGCVSSNTAVSSVTVNSLPNVSAITNNTLLCIGQTASLSASGASTYLWNTSATTSVISVTPTISTNYTVTGTDANGCSKSVVLTQSVSACTGILVTEVLEAEMKIYPNPSNGIFTISGIEQNTSIYIYNAIGELVKSIMSTDNKTTFDLSDYSNGVYFIKIKNDKGEAFKKLIKQ